MLTGFRLQILEVNQRIVPGLVIDLSAAQHQFPI